VSLTEREREILEFIKKEVQLKGYPPSVREIGAAVGLSSSATVHGYLLKLEEKGYIRKDPVKSRSIEVIQTVNRNIPIRKGIPVPVVQIAEKGTSIFQNVKEYLTIPEQFITSKEGRLFLVKVTGDDMRNFGILDGDFILARQQQVALNGELVLVFHQKPIVRRFYKKTKGIYLSTEDTFHPETYLDDVFIIGKVLGVQRKF
jgi:repressor LexA